MKKFVNVNTVKPVINFFCKVGNLLILFSVISSIIGTLECFV